MRDPKASVVVNTALVEEMRTRNGVSPIMSEKTIIPGTVVQLKSGGPQMTVDMIYEGKDRTSVHCQWFSIDQVLNLGNFGLTSLRVVPTDWT
jgi:uncharacterized protein YodC (DUF2158 family)